MEQNILSRERSAPVDITSDRFSHVSEEQNGDGDKESLSSSVSDQDDKLKRENSSEKEEHNSRKLFDREVSLLDEELLDDSDCALLTPKSDNVFDEHTDSGNEDESVTRNIVLTDLDRLPRPSLPDEGSHSDSGIMGACPMDTQGPRRLYQSPETRNKKATSTRSRKTSVPAQFLQRKASDEIHRKVL